MSSKSKTKPALETNSLNALAEAGFAFCVLKPDGTYFGVTGSRKATHKIVTEAGSVLAEPLRAAPKWPKLTRAKAAIAAYGPPRYSAEQPVETPWHPPIPKGATHAEYSTSKASIACELRHLEDFRTLRGGKIRFGRLRYGDTFVSMMPEDLGDETKPAIRQDPIVFSAAPAVAKPAAPQAPKPAKPAAPAQPDGEGRRNGVAEPMKGKTALVWQFCEECRGTAAMGSSAHKAHKAAASAKATAAGINPSTFSVQYGAWKRFNNL